MEVFSACGCDAAFWGILAPFELEAQEAGLRRPGYPTKEVTPEHGTKGGEILESRFNPVD